MRRRHHAGTYKHTGLARKRATRLKAYWLKQGWQESEAVMALTSMPPAKLRRLCEGLDIVEAKQPRGRAADITVAMGRKR